MPRGGGVALISQSGAIAEEAISASHALGIPLGAVISIGNAVHLGLTEYLQQLSEDKACSAVLLYAESFGDAERFKQVCRRVSVGKPVIGLIGGRTEPGSAAAFRHTGSVALSHEEAVAFSRDCGMAQAQSLRELLLAGKAFAAHPGGIGPRVLVLSNSGGPGVLCADRCAVEGLTLPPLPQALVERLRSELPGEAAVANPLDLLADAREDRFDALLMIHVVPFMVDGDAVVTRLAELCSQSSLPILHSMMGTLEHKAQWMAQIEAAGAPMFDNAEDMAGAAGMLARYRALHATMRATT
jgi:acetyltransferase